jgi:ADP-ribosyl-[dinitrogen reductase] hydrolase
MNLLDRYRGSLLGLAAGDALGTAVEFKPRGSFRPVTGITGGGHFGLKAGEWTDDTSMALCLAESLLASGGMDARDQMRRYIRWRDEGHLSSNGRCFDIGNTVRAALARYEQTGEAFAGSDDPRTAGNGSLMRNAPVPLFFATRPEVARHAAADASRTTHGAMEAIEACRMLTCITAAALDGLSKKQLLGTCRTEYGHSESIRIAEVASGSYAQRQPPQIRGSGYVGESLEAALWAFHCSESFEEGALLAVNLGDDADTTGAVYGQLAGAFYKADGIPHEWLAVLARRDLIEAFAAGLFSAAYSPSGVDVEHLSANPETVVACSRTLFICDTPGGELRLRVGERHDRLDALVDAERVLEWAYFTPSNASSPALSADTDRTRQTRLDADIRQLGLKAYPARVPDGGNWPDEESLLVLGLDESAAARLGRAHGRAIVVVGRRGEPARLRWCTR